ncbi:MAG: site-specific DNA-methyltransferase [Planctomycetes bacterium]|nr:site-specific DNA-methyltransferase [Planctomycetota bacterium]
MKNDRYNLTEYRTIHVLKEEHGTYQVSPTPRNPGDAVINGDAAQVMQVLHEHSVQAVVTSPPYYKQRDYDADCQLGNEPTPEEYIRKLVGIISACKSVLKPDGLLWLNLGDKYLNGKLLGLPWRVAIALSESGWTLRSDVIWHKPNAMPASIKNRPTTDHEYVFMLSQGAKYQYDADAIREPHVTFTDASKMRGGRGHFGKPGGTPEAGKNKGNPNLHRGRWDQAFHPLGRNKRTVWSIPLSKCPEAHFAVFPEKLVENCILASTRPEDTVLDPFCGSGTTLLVAHRLGRHFIGIDIKKEYCMMALRRLNAVQRELPFAQHPSQSIGG